MREYQPNERVAIDNLTGSMLTFRAIESQYDVLIDPHERGNKRLTVSEVQSQISAGNKFFVGTDGKGSHAYLKIVDDGVRAYLFGASSDEDSKGEKQNVLDMEHVRALLAIKGRDAFMKALNDAVQTQAEKLVLMDLCDEVGVGDLPSYKVNAIEAITGRTFSK